MKFYFMNSKGVINLEEVWRDITEYEGFYQVSTLGRVKNSRSGRILKGKYKTTGGYTFKYKEE